MKKLSIDIEAGSLEVDGEGFSLFSPEGFDLLSDLWLKVGWNERFHYTSTWMGRPVLQLPEDLVRFQEVIWEHKPDVIIETGIALGGSLLFYASLCKAIDKGRVIGIDVDLRPPNRRALEEHPLFPLITVVDGSSTDAETVERVKTLVKPGERVMVILDSNHSKGHVRAELEAYASFVSSGCYLVAADGLKKELGITPRGKSFWEWDNPVDAVHEFLAEHPEFALQSPKRKYSRSPTKDVTHLQSGWLLKR